jgi:predicted transcriptional regulator
VEEKIVELLEENETGLSTTERVKLSSLSRSIVRTILARLEGGEKVFVRKVGMAEVYSIK